MTSVYKRSQINLYDPIEQEFHFTLSQGLSSCDVDVPTPFHVQSSAFKVTSGNSVVENVASSILTNASAVLTEKTRAEAKEAELKTELDAEVTSRISADSLEAVARQLVQTNLNTESTARASADVALQQSIEQEASSRLSADLSAQDQIMAIQTAHYTDKQSADQDRTLIRSEFATADTALDNKITVEKERVDSILALSSEQLNSFREIADAYASADSNLQTLITTLTTEFNALKAVVDSLAPPPEP
uniref:Uncharacterized protein n=1 Tax=viral metagenome TaxID=1070528 RepID=A0A6C0JTA4_9ZZZZ